MSLSLIGVAFAFFMLLCGYVIWRFYAMKSEIEHLLKAKASLEQDKAVLTTQRNNQRERKKNENKANTVSRNELLDCLQQSNDLRD